MGNPPRPRKRVDAEATPTLKRAKDGSAFSRCESCNKDVPVVLIDMHSCTLDATIKMKFESQIEERPAVSKNPLERKKKTVSSEKKESKRKRSSKERDPNMPKRPPTAFFVFMDEFRKKYKEENPEDAKSVAKVAKEGGEKWKSMTTEEKKQYIDKAAELKAEYEKAMEKYSSEKPTEKEDEAVDSSNEE
ncbi:high mobility group B protein 7-like [Nymphaea colorata]|nr:high mobility group B protein 7-like [Nymphaea colorata]